MATKGSAPTSSHAYDPTTNRLLDSSYTYDANGNLTAMPGLGMTYNEENRMTQAVSNLNGTERYGYDPEGMKVWQRGPDGVLHVYFNGVDGKPLGDFTGTSYFNGSYTVYNPVGGGTPMVYFAGKRIDNNTVEDRVATAVAEGGQGMKFFPYGELRSGTAGVVQYASYTRDSVVTNLDYAQHRWYSSQIDRFTTVDPKAGSANPEMPQSWNKYAYTLGDPADNSDPTGLQDEEDADLNCYEYGMLWPSVVCDLAAGPRRPVVQVPADAPDPCPKNMRFFLQYGVDQKGETALDAITDLANRLNINRDFLLALSSYESGWLTAQNYHNWTLDNLFGVTNAGGNNLGYSSYQDAVNDWYNKFGSLVQGAGNYADFLKDLQSGANGAYNTKNPQWSNLLQKQYGTIETTVKKKCLDADGDSNGADYAPYHYNLPTRN